MNCPDQGCPEGTLTAIRPDHASAMHAQCIWHTQAMHSQCIQHAHANIKCRTQHDPTVELHGPAAELYGPTAELYGPAAELHGPVSRLHGLAAELHDLTVRPSTRPPCTTQLHGRPIQHQARQAHHVAWPKHAHKQLDQRQAQAKSTPTWPKARPQAHLDQGTPTSMPRLKACPRAHLGQGTPNTHFSRTLSLSFRRTGYVHYP